MTFDTLAQLVDAVPPNTMRPNVVIDISRFVNADAGTATLTFRELDTRGTFQGAANMEAVDRIEVGLPDNLRELIGNMAQAHVAPPPPEGKAILPFYVNLALKNKTVWMHVVTEYSKAFPSADFQKLIDDAKKDSGAITAES